MGVLAAAAAAVSWQAQYMMVWRVKQAIWVAALEAGIPDIGAVVFAALGIALALHGRRAVRPRALNAACIGISLVMNALAAGHGWRDLAIWVMPAAVYALASDTLIGVVRAWVLARARELGETLAEDGPTPLSMAGGAALWLLRLVLAPKSTLAGFRSGWSPTARWRRAFAPGTLAQLEAVRRAADEQVTLAIGQRDDAVGRAAAQAEQARGEADRARAAEAEVRGELDRVRADARQAVTQALAGAARERDELRGWAAGRRTACAPSLRRPVPMPPDWWSRSETMLRGGSPAWKPTAQGCARNGTGWPRTFAPPPAGRGGTGLARGGRAQRARAGRAGQAGPDDRAGRAAPRPGHHAAGRGVKAGQRGGRGDRLQPGNRAPRAGPPRPRAPGGTPGNQAGGRAMKGKLTIRRPGSDSGKSGTAVAMFIAAAIAVLLAVRWLARLDGLQLAGIAAAVAMVLFGWWAVRPQRRLPRHRVRHMRLRLRLRLHPGPGHATLFELWLRWGRGQRPAGPGEPGRPCRGGRGGCARRRPRC